MAQSKWIYGGGAVLLAGLIVWAVTSVPEIPQQTDEPTGPRIMSYMDNTLHEERDGRTIWQMTAEQMNVDIDTNDTGMVKIDGTFYSDDGRTLTLKADEGRMDSKTRDIVLTGTIEATTSDGASLRAKQIKWTAAEGSLTAEGDAELIRDDMQLSCDRLSGVGQDHWQATGSVHMVKAGRTFTGPVVDYYPSQNEYVLAASGGTMTSADGTFSADHLEGWLKENRFIGTGNAHLVSPPRDLEGGGDRVEYFGMAERPYAVLDGNAWVYQGNNMARSNHMTVYLADDGSAVTE